MSEQSYTIFEPGKPRRNPLQRADELVFVRDGFSFWAMVMPVLWMIYHRLWLPLAGFVAAIFVLLFLAWLFGAPDGAGSLLMLGLSVGFGVLANDIRREMLDRKGYQLVASIAGPSELECERRFFASWEPLVGDNRGEAA